MSLARRSGRLVAGVVAALAILALAAAPARAAGSSDGAISKHLKLIKMSEFTQTARTSFDKWSAVRAARPAWSTATFDWSTDLCSNSPDRPFGFDFRLSCYRHDWGYRNYHDEGIFAANKGRIDSAFYADLLRVCDEVNFLARPACESLAWVYYHAVDIFGELIVSDADLARIAQMLEDAGVPPSSLDAA